MPSQVCLKIHHTEGTECQFLAGDDSTQKRTPCPSGTLLTAGGPTGTIHHCVYNEGWHLEFKNDGLHRSHHSIFLILYLFFYS